MEIDLIQIKLIKNMDLPSYEYSELQNNINKLLLIDYYSGNFHQNVDVHTDGNMQLCFVNEKNN